CGGALSVLGLPPCAAPERYPLSLHDALPIWLPTSRTENAPPWRANSACLRETVTSSRKMSLSGCRPQDVRSLSRRNRLPALGPRFTTSSAVPGGSASTAAWSGPAGSSAPASVSRASNPPMEIVDVDSPGDSRGGGGEEGLRVSGVPQFEQKRASSGLA